MATQMMKVDDVDDNLPETFGQAVNQLKSQLLDRTRDFQDALPAHITPERFQRTIITAVQSDPELLKADRRSLVNACMKCAQDGLLPDKREAALVIFSTSVKVGNDWVKKKEVQYMPMVYGLRKKILQSNEVKDIFATVVYRRELEEGYFVYEEGTERMLRHKPMFDLSDEDCADENVIAAYSIATYQDGTQSYDVLRRVQINKVRQRSQTGAVGKTIMFGKDKGKAIEPKGPWVTDFPEMAVKTALRHHSKSLPMSGDILDRGDDVDVDRVSYSSMSVLASEREDAPIAILSRSETSYDSETGEVAEEDEEEIARRLDAQTDGRIDGDYGEQVTLASALDEIGAAETVIDVNSRVAALQEHLSDTDVDELRSAAMDRIAELKKGN